MPAQPVYDADAVSILQHAYDEACRATGMDPRACDQDGHHAREALAKAVLHAAASGVRDPRVLRKRAIEAVLKPRC
jgi:hypothetical protein